MGFDGIGEMVAGGGRRVAFGRNRRFTAAHVEDSVEYVCGQLGVESVVLGASSRIHIAATKKMIESYLPKR